MILECNSEIMLSFFKVVGKAPIFVICGLNANLKEIYKIYLLF